MTGDELKQSILQMAIQGKLVPQDPENDEPAWKLLERIKEEKERLIKVKKIKKEKSLPPISEEEKLFEIPDNWEWVRLGEIGFSIRGSGIKRLEVVKDSNYPCIRYGELYTTYLDKITSIESSTTKEVFDKSKKATYGCIFMALTGENNYDIALARPYIGKKTIAYGGDMTAYFPIKVDFLYLAVVLNSRYGITQKRERATGNIVVHLSNDKLSTIPIPLPPLEEQKRIVAKLEELQPLVDRYAQLEQKLSQLNKEFPKKLKESILQDAIQGKLTKQDFENDEPAWKLLERIKKEKEQMIQEKKIKKEKSLPPISEGEKPFEIPANWKWVRTIEICEYIQRGKSPKYSKIEQYPVVAQKCNQWSGFTLEKAKFLDPNTIKSYKPEQILEDNDLMWNSTGLGTLGRIGIYSSAKNPYELAVADSHITVIRAMKEFICPYYLYTYFISPEVQNVIEKKASGSTKQKELATQTVKDYLIPLPPLEEQKRIVTKLEELQLIIDKLNQKVTSIKVY